MDNKPNGASVAQRLIAQVIATIWSEFYSFTGPTSESIAAKIYM
jgi:hypothetical protein